MTAPGVGALDRLARWGPVRAGLTKVFPGQWSFLLGEIALFSFVVLVGTGLFLAFPYDHRPGSVVYQGDYQPLQGVVVSRAYASTLDLSFEVPGGLWVRQVHHWAALVFTGAIVAHAARVFFTGAFRRPRRLNWGIGLTLAILALANGFFGLSLPDDLLSGTGARIGYTFALSVPVVGPELAFALFGGEFPADEMIARLYWLHVLVVPVAIGALLGLHLWAVFRQKHTHFAAGDRREDNVIGDRAWPVYAAKSSALLLAVTGTLFVLGGVAQINPVWQYGPYSPAAATVPAQPDVYLQWVEGALRIAPPVELDLGGYLVPAPFLTGLAVPVVLFALLYLWPHLEEWATGDRDDHHVLDRPRDRPVRTAAGAWGLTLLAILTAAASHDQQALWLRLDLEEVTRAYRAAVVAAPPVAALVTWRTCQALRAAEAAAASGGPEPMATSGERA